MAIQGEITEHDAPEGLVFTTLDITKHAQGVADMWNASDANWPGTWTNGVPETAQSVTRSYELQECIETFLCLEGDVIGGYCKVMPDLDEPGVDYVALVNVPPTHQKKGIARRLLQRATKLAVERTSNRLDLHTWTSNLNAVPLYKKVGFMWMPDTDIHMLNFMPGILRLDAAKDFFATRDWYRVFRRPLDQEPDEERWQGMKVFTYGFVDSPEAADDSDPAFLVRIDREARAICAIETPAYAVAATTDRLEPARGGEAQLTWTVTNRASQPLPITVLASGTPDLLIDYRGSVVVEPGATATLTAACRISPDAADVKQWLPVPSVKAVVLLGDQVVELSTGLRPRDALEITTLPNHLTLAPGTGRTVTVRMRNRLTSAAKVELRAIGAEGLDLSWTSQSLEVDAEGWCGAELEVAVPPGPAKAYSLDLAAIAEADGNRLPVKAQPRHVYSLTPGTVLASRVKKGVRVESDQLRVIVGEVGGANSITAVAAEATGAGTSSTVGPPFSPSEFHTLDYELDFEHRDGSVEISAVGRSKRWPGFVLTKKLLVGSGPMVEQWTEAFNGEMSARTIQFRTGIGARGGFGSPASHLVLPLASGITRGPNAESFPGGDDDESKKPGRLTEGWWAQEVDGGGLVGAIWSEEYEELDRNGTVLLSPKAELAPGERAVTERVWVLAGSGTWRQVRNLWKRRVGIAAEADAPLEVDSAAVRLTGAEGPVLVAGDQAQIRLRVTSETTWPLGGKLTLSAPPGWQVEPAEIDTSAITWRTPGEVEVTLSAPASGAGLLTADLEDSELARRLEVPVLAVAEEDSVVVSRVDENEAEVWEIGTSRSVAKVVPHFGGATVSWKVDGVEQLASDYPEATHIAWLLPWYGGISPVLLSEGSFPGYLWRETFEAEEVEEKDKRGLVWRGVQVGATSSHEDTRDLRVESTVMALAGAPVLKHVVRLVNSTGAMQNAAFGSMIFATPGGSRDATRAHGENLRLNSSGRMGFNSPGTWAAAENPASGATVLLTSRRRVGSMKLGTDGAHFMNLRELEVAAGGSGESVSYLVAAPSLAEAKAWRALTELD